MSDQGSAAERAAARCGVAFAIACCASMLLVFLVECWPSLTFRYDIDPGDGDVLNGAARILAGLPLYGDWEKGDVSALYTPLYYYYLSLAHPLGLEPAVFARVSNMMFLLASFAIAAAIVRHATRESPFSWLWVTATLFVVFRRAAPMRYNGHGAPFLFLIIRPDALVLALQMLACYLVVVHPSRVVLLAVVAGLCPFIKQQAIVVPGALLLYYLIADRTRFWRFATTLGVVAAGLTIPLEVLNNGSFLDSTLIKPARAIGAEPNWAYVAHLLGIFYMTWRSLLLAAFGVLGLVVAVRRRISVLPLTIVFAIDAVLFLKLGQNDGAGSSYLWLHWMLLAIFGGVGLAWVGDALPRHGRAWLDHWLSRSGATTAAAIAGMAIVASSVSIPGIVRASRIAAATSADLQAVGARHEALLAEIARSRPGRLGRWYADRQATALVRIGQILDQEAATLKAVVASGLASRQTIIARFSSGEYHFVQRTWMTDIPLLESIFDACYRVHSESRLPDRGEVRRVEILEYVGGYLACRYDSQ